MIPSRDAAIQPALSPDPSDAGRTLLPPACNVSTNEAARTIQARVRDPRSCVSPGGDTASLGLIPMLLLIGALLGCAGGIGTPARPGSLTLAVHPKGPLGTFDSLDGAAADALAYCHLSVSVANRGRFQLGLIHETEDGFSYGPPMVSETLVLSTLDRPRFRISLRDRDVAAYLVHPRSGNVDIDRANEDLDRSERSLIGQGRRQRAVFLLTPSLRIRAYRSDAKVTNLARLVPDRSASRTQSQWVYEIDAAAGQLVALDLDPAAWRAWLAHR